METIRENSHFIFKDDDIVIKERKKKTNKERYYLWNITGNHYLSSLYPSKKDDNIFLFDTHRDKKVFSINIKDKIIKPSFVCDMTGNIKSLL